MGFNVLQEGGPHRSNLRSVHSLKAPYSYGDPCCHTLRCILTKMAASKPTSWVDLTPVSVSAGHFLLITQRLRSYNGTTGNRTLPATSLQRGSFNVTVHPEWSLSFSAYVYRTPLDKHRAILTRIACQTPLQLRQDHTHGCDGSLPTSLRRANLDSSLSCG